MRMCFRSVFLRLGVGAIVLLTLGLTACAAPAATSIIVSPIVGTLEAAQNEYHAQVSLTAPVIAGSNPLTVQLRDAATGKPLHDVTVRVAVTEKKPAPAARDDHANTSMSSHSSASVSHNNPKPDEHAAEKKAQPGPPQMASYGSTQMESHAPAMPDEHASEKKEPPQAEAKNASHGDEEAGHAGKPLTAGKIEGEYVGQVIFPNAGEWLLTVSYEIAGKEKMAMFAVNAIRSAETWWVLSGFLGVNLAVIATAGITKRKTAKK